MVKVSIRLSRAITVCGASSEPMVSGSSQQDRGDVLLDKTKFPQIKAQRVQFFLLGWLREVKK
jgi:hypothetical protein